MTRAAADPQAAQREAQAVALEAAIVAAVTASLAQRLEHAAWTLKDAFRHATTNPGQWAAARRTAADQVQGAHLDIAAAAHRMLPRAAQLGATRVGAELPAWWRPSHDQRTAYDLAGMDGAVRAKLDRAAAHLATQPVDTPARLAEALGRIDVAGSTARNRVGDLVARTISAGSAAAADAGGIDLTWVSERAACLSCTSMAGAVRHPGGLFVPAQMLAPRIIPWLPTGVVGPPAHGSCRCRSERATEGLSEALLREAQRSVARGESAHDSTPERLRAIDLLLQEGGTRLPASARRRASEDLARGRLGSRDSRGLRKVG